MTKKSKRISKAVFTRALANGGEVAYEDLYTVFTPEEIFGYGVYSPMVAKVGNRYVVEYLRGNSCE